MMVKYSNQWKTTLLKISVIPLISVSSLFGFNQLSPDAIDSISFLKQDSSTFRQVESESPYFSEFYNEFKLYEIKEYEYRNGSLTARELLEARADVNYFHKRLTPAEQINNPIPDLPDGVLNQITLTAAEQAYQDQLKHYQTYFKGYDSIPVDTTAQVFLEYPELEARYEKLGQASRIFIVDNLPVSPERAIIHKIYGIGDRSIYEARLSELKDSLAIHYVGEHGEIVSTTIGQLSENEKEYLIKNPRKSEVVQVYPLPKENHPTEEQFTKWQDTYYYAVWLDGNQIENAELNSISTDSIHHYKVMKVRWNANRRKPYDYSVNLVSQARYRFQETYYQPNKKMQPLYEQIIKE